MTEAEALAILRSHYKVGGWAYQSRSWTGSGHRLGRWSCSCGAFGKVHKDEQVTDLHRRHLARELARAAS